MPRRFLKESIKTSQTLLRLSDGAFRTLMHLIVTVDDYGRYHGELPVLCSILYPYGRKQKQFASEVQELVNAELLTVYQAGERHYCELTTFVEHQGQPRATNPKFPGPDMALKPFIENKGDSNCAQLRADVLVSVSESRIPSSVTTPTPSATAKAALDYEKSWAEEAWPSVRRFVALYNQLAPESWPSVEKLDTERAKKIREYMAQFPDQLFWETVYKQAGKSKWCREYKGAGMDWLIQVGKDGVKNCLKVYEGKYLNA